MAKAYDLDGVEAKRKGNNWKVGGRKACPEETETLLTKYGRIGKPKKFVDKEFVKDMIATDPAGIPGAQ